MCLESILIFISINANEIFILLDYVETVVLEQARTVCNFPRGEFFFNFVDYRVNIF